MKVREIMSLLCAPLHSGEDALDREVHTACGSDMLSDVLAFFKDQSVLLTGLCNPQVMRTAEMMDIICIVFVRGKIPDAQMLALAGRHGLAVMTTELSMFTACGLLYEAGLRGGNQNE